MGLYTEDVNVHAHMWKVQHTFRSDVYIVHMHAVMKSSVKADLDGEEPPTREEEEEEREKMQANPAYLPIEMCYNLQERQLYLNVMMAPPDTDVAEDHTKIQANPAYQSIEMMNY